MKKNWKLVLGLLLLWGNLSQAASWYVDNAAVGAKTGTSWTDAWTSFSAITWNKVFAGDILYISGGSTSKTYNEPLNITSSGTLGNPITVKLDALNPNHNGTVIFDGAYINPAAMKYVTIDGSVNGQQHIKIQNFIDPNERTNGCAIQAYSTTGLIVRYVQTYQVNNGVCLPGSTGFLIQNNSFRESRGDAGVRAINSFGGMDTNVIEKNVIESSVNQATLYGPDGVQGSDGLTIRGNTFRVKVVTYATSGQHTDYCQVTGNNIKIYGNEFIDIGDSGIDMDWWANPAPHDIWIYNNVFRIQTKVDPYPEYIRAYKSTTSTTAPTLPTVTNLKIWNNLFIDNPSWGNILINFSTYNPKGIGNEIRNNIFYNSGNWLIAPSTGYDANSWLIDGNVYYPGAAGVNYLGSSISSQAWVTAHEPKGSVSPVLFQKYAANAGDNDFHLVSTDTGALGKGLDLSVFFTADYDGKTRTVPWSRGSFQYAVLATPTPTPTPTPTASPAPVCCACPVCPQVSPLQTLQPKLRIKKGK